MKYLFYTLTFSLLLCCGCSPDAPPSPVERNDLTMRFFRSLREHAGSAAALQGQKLYLMDKRNYFLLKLIAIQQANSYVSNAQRALNTGHLESAIKELEAGLRVFPDNTELHKQLDKLRKLRHAERFFIAMRSAPNPTAMNSALTAAQAGLSGIESASLNKFFADYKKEMERWNQKGSRSTPSSDQVPIRSFDDK